MTYEDFFYNNPVKFSPDGNACQPVAHCTPQAASWIEYKAFEDATEEYAEELNCSLPMTPDVMYGYLNIAQAYMRWGIDRSAMKYYDFTLQCCLLDGKVRKGYEKAAYAAFQGLCALSLSKDEYVWESCCDTYDVYGKYFRDYENRV